MDEWIGWILAWLGCAAVTSSLARRRGLGEWRWFVFSALAGPVAWLRLYLHERDLRERDRLGSRLPSSGSPVDPFL